MTQPSPSTRPQATDFSPTGQRPEVAATRARLAVVALAVGAFAIGTTEFVTMGVLPQIAQAFSVGEPEAAHSISAYALGVVIGVPVLSILSARLPRRGMLVALMSAYGIFNITSALAPNFELFTIARFLDGVPHGAYFGLASLVAASMVSNRYKGRAVASIFMGLSVANVVGVPAATWMGQALGWRSTFIATAILALLTVVMVLVLVPSMPGNRTSNGWGEARTFFGRRQVWLTLAIGSIGFGGLFSIYSYIATTVTDVGGLPSSGVPLFLLAFGLGMVLGTWLGGELARWSIIRSLFISITASAVLMVVFWLSTPSGWWALPVLFLITAVGAILVTNLQLRLMRVAGDAVTLGAAMNQAALNISNALGAWLGGLVIAAGFGYRSPALVGALMAIAGLLLLVISVAIERHETDSSN